ncbi:MAG: glycyl-radical enzyme activating protein [Pseudomonadota bacterium]
MPPLVYEVQAHALDDGPGIRTAVRFKGCPLSCPWCSAPEGQRGGPEVAFLKERCDGCGACVATCPAGAIDPARWPAVDPGACTGCYACVEACPRDALVKLGVPLASVIEAGSICRDLPFWRVSGGGVTLTGGEPAAHMEAAGDLARRLKQRGTHVLLQTCGHFELAAFEEHLLPWCDEIFYDLKLMDGQQHEAWCGVDNQRILENFVMLQRRAREGQVTLVPRIPLIPRITTSGQNLRSLAAFLKSQRAARVALLLYDHAWTARLASLGRRLPEGPFMDAPWITQTELWVARGYFRGLELVRPDGRSLARTDAGLKALL